MSLYEERGKTINNWQKFNIYNEGIYSLRLKQESSLRDTNDSRKETRSKINK